MATYDEILAEITKSRKELGGDSVSISEGSPAYEALVGVYGPALADILDKPIEQKGPLLPEVAEQNNLQELSISMQLEEAGISAEPLFDADTGAFTGFKPGTGTTPGIAGFQPYLDAATTAAGAAQDLIIDPKTGEARPAAGVDATTEAQKAFDAARLQLLQDKEQAILSYKRLRLYRTNCLPTIYVSISARRYRCDYGRHATKIS